MNDKKSSINKLVGNKTQAESDEISDGTIDDLITEFENKAHTDENGVEFWYARDLQTLLGYGE